MDIAACQVLQGIFDNPVLLVLNVIYFAVNILGSVFFLEWLVARRGLTCSFADYRSRPNTLSPATFFYVFSLWLFVPLFAKYIFDIPILAEKLAFITQEVPQSYLIGLIASCFVSIVGLIVAKFSFADGLRGFGLDIRTVIKDLKAGTVNLICVLPLISASIIALTLIGKRFWGSDFELPRHDIVTEIVANDSIWFRICLVLQAVLVAPVTEEILFRGMFQNFLKNNFISPVLPIVFTSIVFAMVHGMGLLWHWPALFLLSCCMGYAYEKSSSLLRAIVVHALFNSITIFSTFANIIFA